MNPSRFALVFDLDGVIVDSTPTHTEAWRVYLERLGIACTGIERRMHGRRNDEIVADFIGADLAPEAIFAHGAAKEQLYRDMMRAHLRARLVPGVVDFLKSNSLPAGIASNAEPANVEFVLDGAGLRQYFQVVVDGHQVERPKPYPDVYLHAAELLGVPPSRCVVFEDSPAGVAAARSAGAYVAGVQTHAADLSGADVLIADFRDSRLEEWLRSIVRQ